MAVPQKIKSRITYYIGIPLLDIYPKAFKVETHRDICASMIIAALFTMAKTWKQPECLLMDGWVNKNVSCM